MKTIAIDFDDVLFPSLPAFLDDHNAQHGTRFTVADLKGYRLSDVIGGTNEDAIRRFSGFVNCESVLDIPPLPHAREALAILYFRYNCMVVTGREECSQSITSRYLRRWFPEIFCGAFHVGYGPGLAERKLEICRYVGAIALIDDLPETTHVCARAGMTTVLFGEYPWNTNADLPERGRRARVWSEVEAALHS